MTLLIRLAARSSVTTTADSGTGTLDTWATPAAPG